MSEDASPTGGPVTPPRALAGQDAATDHNNSIIEKVRSRVTSIIPFGKWFSPTASPTVSVEQGSHNGGVRRRRNDTVIGSEQGTRGERVADESDTEDLEEEEIAPPSKRSRLNVPEDQSLIGSFQISRGNTSNSFLSSTPHIGARKHLNLQTINQPLHSTISSSITTTRTTKNTTSSLARDIPRFQTDAVDHDVLEMIPENPGETNFASGGTSWAREQRNTRFVSGSGSDMRELKLPSRRPALHRGRLYASEPSSSYLANASYQNQEEDDTLGESVDDETKKNADTLVNGVRASPGMLAGDTASESGESQASSVAKIKSAEPLYLAGVKRFRSSNSSGLNYAAHLQGKKSLFGDKNTPSYLNNSTTSLTSLNRRQSFNSSLYGSTSALSDSRLLNTYSPFYKGNTTYGGAAAYSKYSQNARRVNPVPTLIRPSSSLSTSSSLASSNQTTGDTSAAISNTAKRILELMNQFTTPLSDAKKMASNIKVPALTAHRQRFSDADRLLNKGIRMTTPKTPYSRPAGVQPKDTSGPPVNELQVPSMSQLLQMKKLQSNTERAREITRSNQSKTLTAAKNSGDEQQVYRLPSAVTAEEPTTKHVNKIKNKLTSTRASSKNIGNDMAAPVVSLPDIPLPLKDSAVPKIDFNFGVPIPVSNSSSISKGVDSAKRPGVQPTDKTKSTPSKEFKVPTTKSSGFSFGATTPKSNEPSTANSASNSFKFSSPTATVSAPIANGSHEFVFSAPIQVTAPALGSTNQAPGAVFTNFKFSEPAPVEKSSKLSTPAGNFAFDSGNSASKPKTLPTTNTQSSTIPSVAPQLKTGGSVLDVFKKPTPAEATSTSVSSSAGFGAQFKMTSDKWECSVCMIRNEKSVDKCVACCTSKPSSGASKPAESSASTNAGKSSTPLVPLTNSFGDKFKASTDTWECSVCMIRNKSELSSCAACTTPKPGASSAAASAPKIASMVTSSSSLVPNKTIDTGFKNIVASQSAKWECSACMTRNEPTRNKCACCEQAKPGAASENAPQFAFGTSAASLATNSSFSFGFSAAKKSDESKEGDTAQAKPAEIKQSVSFGASSTEKAAVPATSFSFGFKPVSTSEPSKDETDKTTAPKFTFGTGAQSSKTDSASETSSKTTETPTKKDSEPTGFKFGSSSFAASTLVMTSTKSAEQAKSTPSQSSTTLTTSSSSIFKPIGTVAFASPGEKKSEETAKPPMFGFGSAATKAVTTEASTAKTSNDSCSGAEKPFVFGSKPSVSEEKPSAEVKPAAKFTFGSSSIASGTAFTSPVAQKTAPTGSVATSEPNSASTFVFGKPSTPASITPTFGAVSSNVITSSNSTGPVATAAPSFGALSASTVSSFQSSATSTLSSAPTFGSSSSLSGNQPATTNLFGSNSFTSASSSNAATENKPASNLFQFGAAASKSDSIAATTTTASTPMFGNVSSTTSGRFSFGSSSIASNQSSPAAPFVFGSSNNAEKPKEPSSLGLFGSPAALGQNNVASPSLPAFGSFSSPLQTQSVAPVQPAAAVQPTLFGQTSNMSSPFGSSLTANSTPTFGSSPATNTAAVAPSAFGSASATMFGNGFNSTPAQSNDEPASKKRPGGFNFGAPPANPGGFSFGASTVNNNNNNDSKPFSFSASGSAPAFNFTGNSEATNSSQPFQFGAPQITPAAFNFSGIETTPNAPFQFNAAPAANNIFAVTPTANTAQSAGWARRKARTVTRRTQPR